MKCNNTNLRRGVKSSSHCRRRRRCIVGDEIGSRSCYRLQSALGSRFKVQGLLNLGYLCNWGIVSRPLFGSRTLIYFRTVITSHCINPLNFPQRYQAGASWKEWINVILHVLVATGTMVFAVLWSILETFVLTAFSLHEWRSVTRLDRSPTSIHALRT